MWSFLNRFRPTVTPPAAGEFRHAASRSKALAEQRAWLIEHQRKQENLRNCMALTRQAGFTLIELMVVVAIVGILAVLAGFAYQTYTVRAAASEAVQMLDGAKTTVAENFQSTTIWPGNQTEAGIVTDAGKYVDHLSVGGAGVITATFLASAPSPIAGTTLNMTPYVAADGVGVTWTCGYATAGAGYSLGTPDAAGTGNPAPATTVPSAYLPKACRAGG